MDLSPILSDVMDLMVKSKELKESVENIHNQIQKLITTKVDVATITIREEKKDGRQEKSHQEGG